MNAVDWMGKPRPEVPDPFAYVGGAELDARSLTLLWQEHSTHPWRTVMATDAEGMRHVVLAAPAASPAPVAWSALTPRELAIVDLVADNTAQKVISLKLGLSASSVSAAFLAARDRLGFSSCHRLVRAYCASQRPADPTAFGPNGPRGPAAAIAWIRKGVSPDEGGSSSTGAAMSSQEVF